MKAIHDFMAAHHFKIGDLLVCSGIIGEAVNGSFPGGWYAAIGSIAVKLGITAWGAMAAK